MGKVCAVEGGVLRYEPALDGIRALAVLAVIAYHDDYGTARGGFLGVDAFFVLSGFLITTLLVLEYRRNATISLSHFWSRRARRLLPALFLVLLFVAGYVHQDVAPWDRLSVRNDGRAADQLRPVKVTRKFTGTPGGSVLWQQGNTIVWCTASVTPELPPWMKDDRPGGWITAEYVMLPASTPRRP